MPHSSTPQAAPSWRIWAWLVALAAYGVFLATHIGAVAGGSDSSGYFNEAKLLSHLRVHAGERELPGLPAASVPPYLYVPLGFKPSGPAGFMAPTYPPGLSFLLAAAAPICGWDHAGDLVIILHSLVGIGLVYLLGRACGLTRGWSLLGSAALAASPLYLFMSLQAMSDVPAMVWVLAAVLASMRSAKSPAWALAAGFLAGGAVLIRPSNVLVAIPMALALGGSPRRLILAAAGALPSFALILGINRAAYGGWLESGYGAIGNEFHSELITGTLAYAGRWLPVLLGPVAVLAPLVIFIADEKHRLLLVLWAGSYLAFYSAYRWTHETWWFLRFLLPGAPAALVAGSAVAQAWARRASVRAPWIRIAAPLVLLAATLAVEGRAANALQAAAIGRGELKYPRVASRLSERLPADSIIAGIQVSGTVFYYTVFTLLRSDQVGPADAGRIVAAIRSSHRPLYAVLFPFEQNQLQSLPVHWVRVDAVDDVGIWRADWP